MIIHPTLVLCVGDGASALAARIKRWISEPVSSAFEVHVGTGSTLTPEGIGEYARRLTQSLPELAEAGLTEILAIQSIRVLLIFEACDIELLEKVAELVVQAHHWLQEHGGVVLGLNCILLVFGNGDHTFDPALVRFLGSANQGTTRTVLCLSGWRSVVAYERSSLMDATEILAAIVLFTDVTPGTRVHRFWTNSHRQRYWVGLEEFRIPQQEAIVAKVLNQAINERLSAYFLGQPISQSDITTLLREVFRSCPNNANIDPFSLEAQQWRHRYRQGFGELLIKSAMYITDIGQMTRLLRELAEITRPEETSQEFVEFRQPEAKGGLRVWERLLLWLRRLLGLRSKSGGRGYSPAMQNLHLKESFRSNILSDVLSEFANSLSALPESLAERDGLKQFEYSDVLPKDRLCRVFELDGNDRKELIAQAYADLGASGLTVAQLIAIEFLTDAENAAELIRPLETEYRKIVDSLKLKIRQLWLRESFEEHDRRRSSGQWQNYVFCNVPPPDPETTGFSFGASSIQALEVHRISASLLPEGNMYMCTFVRR